MLVKLKQKSNSGIKHYSPEDPKSWQLRNFVPSSPILMTSLSLPSCFFSLNFSSLRAACYPGVSLSVACVASVSLRFRSKERGVEERERRVQIVGTGACFKNRTCFLLFVFYFFCLLLSLFCVLLCLFFPLQNSIRMQTNCSISLASKSSVHSSPLQRW